MEKDKVPGKALKQANYRSRGARYERIAGAWLMARGYEIVAYNYRCRLGEIDLICTEGGYVVFVEVKYRHSLDKGAPALAVDWRKRKKLLNSARWYMMEKHLGGDRPVRFDVVSIYAGDIRVYKNAFGVDF